MLKQETNTKITKKLVREKLQDERFKSLLLWQKKAIIKMLAGGVTPKKKKRGLTTFLFVPRQNGKSECCLVAMVILFEMGLKVLFTAHNLPLLREMFVRMPKYIDEVECKFAAAEGRQEITPRSNKYGYGSIQFTCRKRSRVGISCDAQFHDEAIWIEEEHIKAFKPMMSTSKYRIEVITGTPPSKTDVAPWLRNQYKHRKGQWIIYGASSSETAMEEMLTKEVNPSLGTLIDEEAIEELADMLDEDSVLSECCGVWHSDRDMRLFKSYKIWSEGGTLTNLHIGVKISPQEVMSVCLVGKLPDGKRVGHFLWHGDIDIGVMRLKNFLRTRRAKITADVQVKEHLAGISGVKFIAGGKQFFERTERFRQQVFEGKLYIDDQVHLISCMAVAMKRRKEGQVGFGFQSMDLKVNVEPLEALAMACEKI